MPKSVSNYVERTSYRLMHSLLRCGSYAPLYRIQFLVINRQIVWNLEVINYV
jgi:hypothetical protein